MANITVPGTTVSLLTVTSKMPTRSFSLPAVKACPSAFFGKDAICGESKTETKCYATRGAYAWSPVRKAQDARYQFTIKASMDTDAGDLWVALQTQAVEREAARQERKYIREIQTGARSMEDGYNFRPVFRVHDSGDLFSPSYTALWQRVCEATPDVSYWFPTRQWRSKNLHMLAALHSLAALPNVAVRPSALRFEDAAPVIPGLAAGTTASTAGFNCPAYTQNNECRDCRACWSKDIEVSYRRH